MEICHALDLKCDKSRLINWWIFFPWSNSSVLSILRNFTINIYKSLSAISYPRYFIAVWLEIYSCVLDLASDVVLVRKRGERMTGGHIPILLGLITDKDSLFQIDRPCRLVWLNLPSIHLLLFSLLYHSSVLVAFSPWVEKIFF